MTDIELAIDAHKSNYPVRQLVLSHSSRTTASSCMRKFEFSKMYGDNPDKGDNFAGDVGNALHRGFQEYLISKDEKKAVMAFLLAYPHELEFQKAENHYNRSMEACYATLMELLRSPILDQFELVHIATRFGDTRPAVEVPFAIEILNSPMPIPVWFVGFIDAILYDRHTDTYIVDDIKTTRIRVNDYSARYEFDEQTVPYAIILEHILGRKITELKVSYLSAYIDLMEPKVALYEFTKTEDHIQDWYMGLCEDIGRMANYYKKEWWPRSTDGNACYSWNKPCFFYDYCSKRDVKLITRMLKNVVREGLFHDGQEPWFEAKLEWIG